mmetsp:Transcript_83537/g.270300  ORF Transcript_83537/g.270300 Transcript_83537/m.270300 type:complete len:217 (-) Transcript_83537:100-750(-)
MLLLVLLLLREGLLQASPCLGELLLAIRQVIHLLLHLLHCLLHFLVLGRLAAFARLLTKLLCPLLGLPRRLAGCLGSPVGLICCSLRIGLPFLRRFQLLRPPPLLFLGTVILLPLLAHLGPDEVILHLRLPLAVIAVLVLDVVPVVVRGVLDDGVRVVELDPRARVQVVRVVLSEEGLVGLRVQFGVDGPMLPERAAAASGGLRDGLQPQQQQQCG